MFKIETRETAPGQHKVLIIRLLLLAIIGGLLLAFLAGYFWDRCSFTFNKERSADISGGSSGKGKKNGDKKDKEKGDQSAGSKNQDRHRTYQGESCAQWAVVFYNDRQESVTISFPPDKNLDQKKESIKDDIVGPKEKHTMSFNVKEAHLIFRGSAGYKHEEDFHFDTKIKEKHLN